MYSTLLLEDFTTSLKRYIAQNNPVSTFIVGLLAGIYGSQYSQFNLKRLSNYLISKLLNIVEESNYDKFAVIINKFTTPIDKVVKSIKDKSFIAPSSKFYDIIQIAISLLLLFLGFAIGEMIVVLRDGKKEGPRRQCKGFIKVVLITFVIIFSILYLLKSPIIFFTYGDYHKISFTTFKNSKNKIKQAVVKAYELVVTKYPEFATVPLYYVAESDTYGFYCVKLTDKSLLGIPNKLVLPLTEDELVAIYLHEFGHLLNVHSRSPIPLLALYLIEARIRLLTKLSGTRIIAEIGGNIIDRFFASVASFNQEIYADVFATSMGYGRQLKSALQKLENSMSTNQTNLFAHRFLTHPTVGKRVDYIEQAEKHFKQETNELFEKSTEIIKEELNKERVNV